MTNRSVDQNARGSRSRKEITRTQCQTLATHVTPHSANLLLTRDYSVQHLNELNV